MDCFPAFLPDCGILRAGKDAGYWICSGMVMRRGGVVMRDGAEDPRRKVG